MPPSISGETSVPQEVQVTQDSAVTLECHAAGNPPPQISWLKNGRPLLLSPRARLLSGDSVLRSVLRDKAEYKLTGSSMLILLFVL